MWVYLSKFWLFFSHVFLVIFLVHSTPLFPSMQWHKISCTLPPHCSLFLLFSANFICRLYNVCCSLWVKHHVSISFLDVILWVSPSLCLVWNDKDLFLQGTSCAVTFYLYKVILWEQKAIKSTTTYCMHQCHSKTHQTFILFAHYTTVHLFSGFCGSSTTTMHGSVKVFGFYTAHN